MKQLSWRWPRFTKKSRPTTHDMRWPDFWGYEGYKVADRMCKVQKCHRYSQKNGAYKSRPTFTFQGRLLDLLQDALTRSLVRFPFDTFPVALAVAKDRHRLQPGLSSTA